MTPGRTQHPRMEPKQLEHLDAGSEDQPGTDPQVSPVIAGDAIPETWGLSVGRERHRNVRDAQTFWDLVNVSL